MSEPLHLVCPACLSTNRVPAERLGDGPICGRCREPLLPGHPVALDAQHFGPFVQRSDLPVLVDCWAEWCGPCRAMAPQFEAAAQAARGRVLFAKLDTESAPDVAGGLGIRAIPTLILFRGGRELARSSGAMSSGQILAWLDQQAV